METIMISYGPTRLTKITGKGNERIPIGYGEANVTGKSLPEILFITSFPPRQCGIATYSQDLVEALNNQFENTFKCTVCALESETEQHIYKSQPKYVLNTDQRNSFAKTAFNINRDENVKLVVIQHEFGFFASKGHEFELFYNSINKPIVFAFHTVLPKPSSAMKAKVQNMACVAASVVVMTKSAADILITEYGIASELISVIPHGTHLVQSPDRNKLKEQYLFSDRKILSTFGLLSSGKSIETTLDALPAIVERFPDTVFLVLGKTHPSVVKTEGEQYRRMLEKKVVDLNLTEYVKFVNEYLPLQTLLEYLQLTDVYLFTSKDPNQAVSGTFSYAVSCGCPVVSTPIPHAKEVLSNGNGLIFDFGNSSQLSKSVISLLDNGKLREEISSNSIHKMASTAWQNSAIAHALLFESLATENFQLNYRIPPLNIKHLIKMTDNFGIFQFSKIATPDVTSGYTLDDNARALIAACMHFELTSDTTDLYLIDTYFQFIKHCVQPNGMFLNYVNKEKEFTNNNYSENLEDSNGRAIWALGYLISLTNILPAYLTEEADVILQKFIPHLDRIHSTRAMAFVIKGIHYQNKKENNVVLRMLADRLVQMYRHESTEGWHWFENYLTYGNSLLPEALLCAYLSTNDRVYKTIAMESFEFLLSKIFVNGKIKVISNKGWLVKDKINTSSIGGEQPIDVSYTIMALEKFYLFNHKEEYRKKAISAFNWFLGDNHLHQIVYNPCTGGCYDGLEEFNVNLNQGAESTVSCLMARLTVERTFTKAIRLATREFSMEMGEFSFSNL